MILLKTIVDSIEALETLKRKELTFKLSYAINKNFNKLAPAIEAYRTKTTNWIVELGEIDEKIKKPVIKYHSPNMPEYIKRKDELEKEEIDVEIHKFNIKEFSDSKEKIFNPETGIFELQPLFISPLHLQQLEYMLIDDE